MSEPPPAPCAGEATGRVLDVVRARLEIVVPVERGTERRVLDDIVERWDAEGHDVQTERMDEVIPVASTTGDGFSFGVTASADTGQVSIAGSTDCLEPDPE